MKHTTLLMFIATSVVTASGVSAELERSLTDHPDPETARFYVDHESDIEGLRRTIRESPDHVERLAALEQLSLEYPDAAFDTALALVEDPAETLALKAVTLISAAIVMSDHDMVQPSELSPRVAYMMERHEAGRAALRKALDDQRRPVREKAAKILAGLSDEAALKEITRGLEAGLYSQTEAINLYGLARPEAGAAYIAPYLERGEGDARTAAVMYLGANPAYQDQIRSKVFLAPDQPDALRAQAASVLSRYDTDFSTYALMVTVDPALGPEIYVRTLNGYLDSLQAQGKTIDLATARVFRAGVGVYIQKYRNDVAATEVAVGELKELQDRLRM